MEEGFLFLVLQKNAECAIILVYKFVFFQAKFLETAETKTKINIH